MLAFPAILSWTCITLSVLSPFYLPTTFLLWTTVFCIWGFLTIVPLTFSLRRATKKILSMRRNRGGNVDGPAGQEKWRGGVDAGSAPYHVFLIPNYKEDEEIMAQVLEQLSTHSAAKSKYIVLLAMEGREEGSVQKAKRMEQAWKPHFLCMTHSVHEANLPGECAGKASNATAAARHLATTVIPGLAAKGLPVTIEETIVTVLDADILLGEDYIELLEENLRGKLGNLDWHRTIWCPTMAFSNTDWDPNIPTCNSLYDMFWSSYHVAYMEHELFTSGIKYPCATYSISLLTLVDMDYWEVGDIGLGEDHHQTIRLFFTYEENARWEVLWTPFKATHVGGPTICSALMNRYTQAHRHYLASVDIAYSTWRAWKQRKNLTLLQLWYIFHEGFLHFMHLTLSPPTAVFFFNVGNLLWMMWPGIEDWVKAGHWIDAPSTATCAAWGVPESYCGDGYLGTVRAWFMFLNIWCNGTMAWMFVVFVTHVEQVNFQHQVSVATNKQTNKDKRGGRGWGEKDRKEDRQHGSSICSALTQLYRIRHPFLLVFGLLCDLPPYPCSLAPLLISTDAFWLAQLRAQVFVAVDIPAPLPFLHVSAGPACDDPDHVR